MQKGNTVIIIEEFMQDVLGLSGAELMVYAVMYSFCKLSGSFYAAVCYLASRVRVSERAVQYALGRLIKRGYIKRCGENIISTDSVKRNERHNIKNLLAALTLTEGYVSRERIRRVAEEFSGLSHRMEHFYSTSGIDFIDSSIDSTPARTKETLRSLDRQVVIILGGRGKGLDYSELIPEVEKYAKKTIITGENAKEIYNAISNATDSEIIEDFEEAVLRGKRYAEEVGTLLLSPASTSFDRFRNYAERGDRFKDILLKIY